MPGYDPARRLRLFPVTAGVVQVPDGARLALDGHDLEALARDHGTPLYLYDQATLDRAVDRYRRALETAYPGPSAITYAAKAFLCLAVAQWAGARGLSIDCSSAGEIAVARAAGVDRARIVAHGVNKSPADLAAALDDAGTLVVDHPAEVEQLVRLAPGQWQRLPAVWLRFRPGVAVDTHDHTQTGQADSKFGMDAAEVRRAAARCLQAGLPLTGLHFHLGSQFDDPAPIGRALDAMLDLAASLARAPGWTPQVLSPGGGWGVAYHEDNLPHPSVEDYVQFISSHVAAGCRRRDLPLPRLHLEPGRSLVARAGVALYRVGAVKHTAGRRWLLLDGGLADNPRRALYGARYSALPVRAPGRPSAGPAWLAGPYCESGDVLAA
ncbi:MAG: diaminopimelate decarboxylase, partial [Anaerolineae bacterium]